MNVDENQRKWNLMPYKQRVGGSNPSTPTTEKSGTYEVIS